MIIKKQSNIEGQYTVELFTKEDSGHFIYKVVYGAENHKFIDDLESALKKFENFCKHQLECEGYYD